MNKKGFTLIELLAVIVILAIIAVIAIPRILNVVEEAKKGSAEASALGYIDAVEKQIMINATSHVHDEITDGTYEVPLEAKYGVTVKGKAPDSGEIVIENGKVKTYSVTVDGYTISFDGETKFITKNSGEAETCTAYTENEVVYENGTPKSETFKTKCRGSYKIELWGAGAPSDASLGFGGYTSGIIELNKKVELYIYVGEAGDKSGNAKFNGGGAGGSPNGKSGGGATDVRTVSGNWDNFDSLKSRIMVAAGSGGGSGASLYENAGEHSVAGGLTGYSGGYYSGHTYVNQNGLGGTQTAGGAKGNNHYSGTGTSYAGAFGIGGNSNTNSDYAGAGGGGGGYYGGGGGGGTKDSGTGQGGGGGSSFISGHAGCNAIDKNSTSNNIIHTNQPNHYSGYVFSETVMIDGYGYRWTTTASSTVSNMPTHDGTSTMKGNSGNGYAKITYLGN